MQTSPTETDEFIPAAPSEPSVCPANEEPRALPAGLPGHPLAELFPPLEEHEFRDLVNDIKAHGLRSPMVTLDGAILDGRNRYRACIEADVEPVGQEYSGSDPIAFVMSANLFRRHLNESQRAMIAAGLADMAQGTRTDLRPSANLHKVSQSKAARLAKVSRRSVARAATVRRRGIPELRESVERGETAVSWGAKLAALPPDEQREAMDSIESMRSAFVVASSNRREVGLADAIRRASEQVGHKLYGVIYADPPWPSRCGHDDPNGNPTDSIEALRSMSIPAAEDAVLFLWATVVTVPDALSIMKAWGFIYRFHVVWVKRTGQWDHDHHELLLIGKRGDFPHPVDGEKLDSVQFSDVGSGGVKPEIFPFFIKELFPHMPCLELFARAVRPGWDTCIVAQADGSAPLSEASSDARPPCHRTGNSDYQQGRDEKASAECDEQPLRHEVLVISARTDEVVTEVVDGVSRREGGGCVDQQRRGEQDLGSCDGPVMPPTTADSERVFAVCTSHREHSAGEGCEHV
jgi:N6-adenosine-specific RNA methylase IME4